MKTSLVIIDGAAQVVLTPETDFEKRIIEEIDAGKSTLVITIGGVEV